MKVKVDACWGGKETYFRLTMPNGDREFITSDRWTRKAASEALDLLEHVYGFSRAAIRFLVS